MARYKWEEKTEQGWGNHLCFHLVEQIVRFVEDEIDYDGDGDNEDEDENDDGDSDSHETTEQGWGQQHLFAFHLTTDFNG